MFNAYPQPVPPLALAFPLEPAPHDAERPPPGRCGSSSFLARGRAQATRCGNGRLRRRVLHLHISLPPLSPLSLSCSPRAGGAGGGGGGGGGCRGGGATVTPEAGRTRVEVGQRGREMWHTRSGDDLVMTGDGDDSTITPQQQRAEGAMHHPPRPPPSVGVGAPRYPPRPPPSAPRLPPQRCHRA
jgi:hypothetical protein